MSRLIPPVSIALAVALIAGCGTAASTPSSGPGSPGAESRMQPASASTDRPAQPARLPSEAGHIHGLTVTPAGDVLIGTHNGTYAVATAGVSKVGQTSDDLMGFTGAGGRLLASGHPGPASRQPNPLGLMESRDGGSTWQSLSQVGESDFHALTASGSAVYGFDGTLKVSNDGGRTWADHGAVIAPAVLAAHPRTPTTVLATTAEGVQQSTDGGRTFRVIGGELVLQTLSWPAAEVLYGVEPSGQIHLSTDGGRTWSRRSRLPGQPHAFAAADSRTLAAATADGVYLSSDGGATLRQLATAD